MPRCHRSIRSNRRRQAFTLSELIIVLAIIGILSSIALPRVASSIARHRLDAAVTRVRADLAYARQRALQTSASQTVLFDSVQDRYRLVGMSHLDDPGKEYVVLLSDEPYGAVIVSADFGGDEGVVFDLYGTPDSGGSVVIKVGDYQKTVTVDGLTGQMPPVKEMPILFVPL